MARTVGEVMTRDVVEARRDTSFKDVVRLLERHRISGLPVVDHDDKVVGVISGTDLVRHQAARPGRHRVMRFGRPRPSDGFARAHRGRAPSPRRS
ncbi:CBS domain-containing protein [Streptomyces sp. NPDC086783]|uniref:CBS domain-containing protein n=1 Tax=Streptomyces sp. NPDC086783 TaxID=3365758 RepID=UPI00381DC6BD